MKRMSSKREVRIRQDTCSEPKQVLGGCVPQTDFTVCVGNDNGVAKHLNQLLIRWAYYPRVRVSRLFEGTLETLTEGFWRGPYELAEGGREVTLTCKACSQRNFSNRQIRFR